MAETGEERGEKLMKSLKPMETEALDILESMLDVADLKTAALTGIPNIDQPMRIGTCRISDDDAAILRQYISARRAAPENKALTVTLPCKTGDTVYYIAWHEKQPIKRGTVWQFGMDETHVWASITVSKTSVVTMNVDNLYLTREAAEQALAARRPEDAK